jgi:hypothetical protein
MTCSFLRRKLILLLTAAMLLLAGPAFSEENETVPTDPAAEDLALAHNAIEKKCLKIAGKTIIDISKQAAEDGITAEENELAQQCFRQNICATSSTLETDRPSCARAIALNSYLINIAYRTQKPPSPPYPETAQNSVAAQNPAATQTVGSSPQAAPISPTNTPVIQAYVAPPPARVNPAVVDWNQ